MRTPETEEVQKWERKLVTLGKLDLPKWVRNKDVNKQRRTTLKLVSVPHPQFVLMMMLLTMMMVMLTMMMMFRKIVCW
jgi:hypothetical protein